MRVIPIAAALFVFGGLAAQDAPVSTAKAEFDALVAEVKAATAVQRAAVQEVQKTEAYRQATAARDAQKVRELLSAVQPVDYGGFAR